jgi:hypothetical protein
VDDAVLVDPLVRLRPMLSLRVADRRQRDGRNDEQDGAETSQLM